MGGSLRGIVGLIAFLCLAGCTQPAAPDPHPALAAAEPVLADDVAILAYHHALTADADPPGADFDVPAGAENLSVVLQPHGVPCGAGVGLPESRGVAMTLTSPSGKASMVKIPAPLACATPALDVSGYAQATVDAEAGHWTALFTGRGVGADLSVSVLARPATEPQTA